MPLPWPQLVFITSTLPPEKDIPFCAETCTSAISRLRYQACPREHGGHFWSCVCRQSAYVQSLALCVEEHCQSSGWVWQQASETCAVLGEVGLEGLEEVLKSVGHTQHYNLTEDVWAPMRVPEESFAPLMKTNLVFQNNLEIAMTSGILFVGAIFLICLFVGVPWPNSQKRIRLLKPIPILARKYFWTPALIRKNAVKGRLGRFTLSYPTRLQTVLLLLYVLANKVALVWNLQLFKENVFWPNNLRAQALRYIADRSGILAIANTPLMIAFGGRNHLLMWLSGSRFNDFNVFHKWIGRICVSHSMLHAFCYTLIIMDRGGISRLWDRLHQPYLIWGSVAFGGGLIILIQGAHVFRCYAYELFLFLHIILSIAWLAGAWYHIGLLNLSTYMPWVYGSCAAWIIDRAVRLGRLVYYNLSWSPKQGFSVSKAAITHLGDYLRIEIYPARHWQFQPGQYIFFHLLDNHFYQSHPFSVVAYPGRTSSKLAELDQDEESKSLLPSGGERRITLYIRPFSGMTRRLAAATSKALQSVLIEGPYGHSLHLDTYDRVLFVAGGIGISGVQALYFDRIEHSPSTGLVWVVRSISDVQCSLDDFCFSPRPDSISIYIRHGNRASASDTDRKILEQLEASGVKVHLGSERPSCSDLIEEEQQLCEDDEALVVVCCGPAAMVDDCRAASVKHTSVDRRIDFFSENLTW